MAISLRAADFKYWYDHIFKHQCFVNPVLNQECRRSEISSRWTVVRCACADNSPTDAVMTSSFIMKLKRHAASFMKATLLNCFPITCFHTSPFHISARHHQNEVSPFYLGVKLKVRTPGIHTGRFAQWQEVKWVKVEEGSGTAQVFSVGQNFTLHRVWYGAHLIVWLPVFLDFFIEMLLLLLVFLQIDG